MQPTIDGLKTFAASHSLKTKVLVAPSFTLGHAISEAAAEDSPWFNLHVHTVTSLARNVIESSLDDKELVSGTGPALFVVDQVLRQQLGECEYFNRILPSLGYSQCFAASFGEFRAAGLETSDPNSFVDAAKGRDFARLLNVYRTHLGNEKLVDAADAVQLALKLIQNDAPTAWAGSQFLVCAHTLLSPVEKDFLDALAGGKLQILPHSFDNDDLPDSSRWACKLYGRGRVQRSASSVEIRRGAGFENEVRQLFDWMVHEKARSDQVEILYTNQDEYLPLLRQHAQKYGIECTFGDGIPLRQTRIGRAVTGLLCWMREGFPEPRLRALVASNLVLLTDRKKMSATKAARLLRKARIGWGRDRYISSLESQANAYRSRAEHPDPDVDEELDDPSSFRARFQRYAEETQYLLGQVRVLFDLVPPLPDELSTPELAGRMLSLLETFLPTAQAEEREGRSAVIESLKAMARFGGVPLPRYQALDQLQEVLNGISIQSSGPKPGCMHISSVAGGGMSGRKFLWVLGMDEANFPRVGMQDPILLDIERDRLSNALVKRSDLPKQDTVLLRGIIEGHYGQTLISYSVMSLSENQIRTPSALVLHFHRKNTSNERATFSEMHSTLLPPADFVADGDTRNVVSELLSEPQAWLKIADTSEVNARGAVVQAFPHLRAGLEAQAARFGEEPTAYHGWLQNPGDDLDFSETGRPLSASALDVLAQCPFKFFLRYILGVQPPDDLSFDALEWLSAMERGRLVHQILHDAIIRLRDEGRTISYEQDNAAVRAIAEGLINAQRDEVPPPNEIAFQLESEAILKTVDVFMREEARRSLDPRRCHVEIPFGISDGQDKKHASPEPIRINVSEGRTLRIHGQIDRLDEVSGGSFEVWDYKTGSPKSYEASNAFRKGRRLQHIIYGIVVEQMIDNAKVIEAGYFFPGVKGRGERISHKRDEWPDLRDFLEKMMNVIEKGEFIHRTNADECTWCDYSSVCGNVMATCGKARRILQNNDPVLLARKELENLS